LPGTTAAFADANIYARATGYIARRNVDIGDRVKAGDLLGSWRCRNSTTRFRRTSRRSLRSQLEVDAGVKAGDRVILNPSLNLPEGGAVRVAAQ
jgi:predicted deacylase